MKYAYLLAIIACTPHMGFTSDKPKNASESTIFNLSAHFINNNSASIEQQIAQKQVTHQTMMLDQQLLGLTQLVEKHWINATCATLGATAIGSYLMLFVYIVRNKNWIQYNEEAWHTWRNDVPLDVLKQIHAVTSAQELWKSAQNKYPGKSAGDLLTLFINETSQEIDRLNTFIETCNKIEEWYVSYITPTITQTRSLALEKLARLHLMQQVVTSTVVAALTV